MIRIAKAAVIAKALGSELGKDGWYKNEGLCHIALSKGGQSLHFRDTQHREGGQLAVRCFKGCDNIRILHTIRELTNLTVCLCPECQTTTEGKMLEKSRALRIWMDTVEIHNSSEESKLWYGKLAQGGGDRYSEPARLWFSDFKGKYTPGNVRFSYGQAQSGGALVFPVSQLDTALLPARIGDPRGMPSILYGIHAIPLDFDGKVAGEFHNIGEVGGSVYYIPFGEVDEDEPLDLVRGVYEGIELATEILKPVAAVPFPYRFEDLVIDRQKGPFRLHVTGDIMDCVEDAERFIAKADVDGTIHLGTCQICKAPREEGAYDEFGQCADRDKCMSRVQAPLL